MCKITAYLEIWQSDLKYQHNILFHIYFYHNIIIAETSATYFLFLAYFFLSYLVILYHFL